MGQIPIDECLRETCLDGGCTNTLVTNTVPVIVTTAGSSLIGVNATVVASCGCKAKNFPESTKCDLNSCFNNGTCADTPYGNYM